MRVLFCSLTSYGFLYPAIGIAQVLRRRGHDVAFVTGVQETATITQAGFENLADPTHSRLCFQTEVWWKDIAVALQVKQIEAAVQYFQPALIVGQELLLGPLLVRERQQIQTAVIGSSTYLWSRVIAHNATQEQQERWAWRYQEFLKAYNAARTMFRLPLCSAPPDENPFLGDRFLLQSIPTFTPADESLPTPVRLVGACLWEPPERDVALDDWLAQAQTAHQPVLYVQPSRTFGHSGFWPQVVEAFQDAPLRIVAAVGRMNHMPAEIPTAFFVREHLLQSQVLRVASAVICGGNSTAVLGALTHGIPMLLLPGGGEQWDVAEQCAAVGVAQILSFDADAATITTVLEQVLQNEQYKTQAQTLKQAFAQVDGCEQAATELEALGKSDHRSWGCVADETSTATFATQAVS